MDEMMADIVIIASMAVMIFAVGCIVWSKARSLWMRKR